jgi:hypothetical protein
MMMMLRGLVGERWLQWMMFRMAVACSFYGK